MARGKNRHPIYEQLKVIDIAAEGKAIAKKDDLVIFIPGCIPGDIVDVRISRKKKKYAEGKAIKFHQYSDERIDAFCSHFGTCGGCKWQSLPYENQLHYKQKQVVDQFERIGHLKFNEIKPILGSKNTKYYRNKLEFTFSNLKWLTKEELSSDTTNGSMNALGFHIPGMFDRIVDVEHCYLQNDPSNQIRTIVKKVAEENHFSFYNQRTHEGFLRNLTVRTTQTGETMVILSVSSDEIEKIKLILDAVISEVTEIVSVYYVINNKKNDTINDLDLVLYHGEDALIETMEELKFKVGPKSFYQTNPKQAYELYKITREFAKLKGDEIVYDLYTGTGTIALFLAKFCKQVIGIEYVPEAIEDAKMNVELNGIENSQFYAGDIKDIFHEVIEKHGNANVIVLDPPRAGIHPNVANTLLKMAPERIVYVSCNPATQARDLALLSESYQISQIQPVDMFPHTHHVENVVLLEKIS